MIGVLKLRRPHEGATPTSFPLPTIEGEEFTVGRHGDHCDVFLYVDAHPSFLSRKHALFRYTSSAGQNTSDQNSGENAIVVDEEMKERKPKVKRKTKRYNKSAKEGKTTKSNENTQETEKLSDNDDGDGGSMTEDNLDDDEIGEGSHWEVVDNKSVNGVFLNGQRLESEKPHRLSPGDRVFFGNPQHSFFLEYEFVVYPKGSSTAIKYEKISERYRSKTKKNKSPSRTLPSDDLVHSNLSRETNGQLFLSNPFPRSVKIQISRDCSRFINPQSLSGILQRVKQNQVRLANSGSCVAGGEVDGDANNLFGIDSTAAGPEAKSTDATKSNGCLISIPASNLIGQTAFWDQMQNSIDVRLGNSGLNNRKRKRTDDIHEQAEGLNTVADDTEMDSVSNDSSLSSVDGSSSLCTQPKRRHIENAQEQSLLLETVGGDLWTSVISYLEFTELFPLREVSKMVCRITNEVLGRVDSVKWSHRWVQKEMMNMLRLCHNLKRIDASGCYNLGSNEVEFIANTQPQIEHLDLSGCSKVSHPSIQILAEKCVNIRSLRLRACKRIAEPNSRPGLCHLTQRCTKLEHLDLRCCNLDDDTLVELLKSCSNLKSLDIGSTGFANVSDRVLLELAKNCSQLEDLGIMCCRNITDKGIEAISQRFGATLKILTVHCCFDISDSGLADLAKRCTALESLNVHRCLRLTDIGIEQLVQGCGRTLKSLDVSACKITDDAVNAIAQYCPNLEVLDVRSCDSITSKSIRNIAIRCKKLEQIDLSCCKGLDDDAIHALAEHATSLKQIEYGKGFNVSKNAHEKMVQFHGGSALIFS